MVRQAHHERPLVLSLAKDHHERLAKLDSYDLLFTVHWTLNVAGMVELADTYA